MTCVSLCSIATSSSECLHHIIHPVKHARNYKNSKPQHKHKHVQNYKIADFTNDLIQASQYVVFVRLTPIHEFDSEGINLLFWESEISREREADSMSEKTVCGWVEKCCLSAHMQSVDTNICSICCPCRYSTDSTGTERGAVAQHVLGEAGEESAQLD